MAVWKSVRVSFVCILREVGKVFDTIYHTHDKLREEGCGVI